MNKKLARSIRILTGSFFLIPVVAQAHVKWFVDESRAHDTSVAPFHLFEPAVMLGLTAAAALILIAYVIDKQLQKNDNVMVLWGVIQQKYHRPSVKIVRIATALWILIAAAHGFILTPIFSAAGHPLLLALEWLTGATLLLLPRVGSASLVILWCAAASRFGIIPLLDDVHVLGLAAFFWLQSTGEEKTARWSVPALRVMTGLSFVIVAVSEKLSATGVGLSDAFLHLHRWNFLHTLGITQFSDRLFILSSGLTELVLGIVLMLGFVTRLTSAVILATLILTMSILGPSELVGHLPFLAIMIFLLVNGRVHHATLQPDDRLV